MSASLDEDLTVLEDLDFDPPCDADTPCNNTAHWFMAKKCCTATYTFCDKCRQYLIDFLSEQTGYTFFCRDCSGDLTLNDIEWTPL